MLQLLVNYDVPPSHQEKFVELFKDLQDSVEHEEGVLVFGLSRTVDQNNIFYLYSGWLLAYAARCIDVIECCITVCAVTAAPSCVACCNVTSHLLH